MELAVTVARTARPVLFSDSALCGRTSREPAGTLVYLYANRVDANGFVRVRVARTTLCQTVTLDSLIPVE